MARHKNTEEATAPIPEQADVTGTTIEQEKVIIPETVVITNEQPDQQATEGTKDLKEEAITIPEQADVLLKIFNQHEYLYIDSTGGVYTGPHDKAVKYINPYHN